MSEQVLKNVGIWIDGRDLAGVSNSVGVSLEAEAPESTTFADEWRTRAEGGLKTSSFSLEGYYDIGEIDAAQFASIGQAGSAMIAPAGEMPGNLAYIIPYEANAWEPGASVGELMGFTFAGEGDGVPHRGAVLDIRETVSAALSTPRQNLGAVPSGQHIVAWVHVNAVGGMMDLALRSAATAQGGTHTERAHRLGVSDTGLYILQASGAITDEYWELYLVPHGANPEFDIAVATAFPSQVVVVPLAPIIPPTPPVGTISLRAGLSADINPQPGEFTINGSHDKLIIPAFSARHLMLWRDDSEADITSVVFDSDPTMANQFAGFATHVGTVEVGGVDGNVWVSNQVLTFPQQQTITVR